MTVKERIIEFIKFEQLSIFGFEKVCGLSNGYINNIRVSISNKTLQKIALNFPHLNPVWLMMGEGSMLKEDAEGQESQSLQTTSFTAKNITVKERLIEFLKYKKIGQNKFAEIVGLSSGYVNNIRQSIPPKTLFKISKYYPELNTAWLLTGEGTMLKSDADSQNTPGPERDENFSPVKERISQYINRKGISKYKFYQESGISRGILDQNTGISEENTAKFLAYAPEINPTWLITGKGKMLKSDADNTKIDIAAESKTPLPYIKNSNGNTYKDLKNGRYIVSAPVVPFYAYGRYLSDFADEAFMTELDYVEFIVDHIGRGKYVSFEIKGDSMDDGSKRSVPERSLVLCREVKADYWRDKLHYRKFPYWIIVHKTSILCKQIIDHNVEKGIIKCHSLNPSPEYQDFEIGLNEVKQLLNIIKIQKDVEFV